MPCSYQALDWESILHGNAGELLDYTELAILPDKIARFLYQYHSESYSSLQLPQGPELPDDRSNFDVHGMLTHQVDLQTIHTQSLSRTDPYWTLCRYYGHLQAEAISFFTTPLLLVTKKTRRLEESNEFRPGPLSWMTTLDAENQVFMRSMLHMQHTQYMLC